MNAAVEGGRPLTEDQRALAESGMGVAIGFVKGKGYLRRERDDYTQVGLLAVVDAARTYGPHVACDFPAYAWQRVRKAVADYRAANRPIRIPIDSHKSRYKSGYASFKLAKERAIGAKFVALADLPGGEDLRELGRSREPDPAASCETGEVVEAMWMAVSSLPDGERDVIEAVCLGGKRVAELAREQGRFPSVIDRRRERGIAKLRVRMKAFREDVA